MNNELKTYIESFKVEEIPAETNFWMVRTQGGAFYHEYVSEKYIALGWNIIDSQTVFTDTNKEILKERIKNIYGSKRPAEGINKSIRFMHEMKEGDFVIIPCAGSTEISICKIGSYYEIDKSDSEELSTIQKIKSKDSQIKYHKCPYKKRRRIEVLLTVDARRIGYRLLRAISSYHGLSDMNEYATDILNCVYDCYVFNEDMYIPINIAKNEPITARELSGLMYGVSNYYTELVHDEACVLATANINSPGKYVLCLKRAFLFIKDGAIPLVALSVFLFGGEFAGNTMQGVIPGAINAYNQIESMPAERLMQQEQLRGERLNNYLKAIEALEATENLDKDINKEALIHSIQTILAVEESLCLQSNEEFAQFNENSLVSIEMENVLTTDSDADEEE